MKNRALEHTARRAIAAITAIGGVLAVGASLTFAGCATNPATGGRQLALITVQEEIAMGRKAHEEVVASMGVYDDPELQAYVDRIGQRIAQTSERPDLPWTFTVLDDSAVNAFALPGGYIYLTRGILGHMRSEAEMVSVLGHEIGHVTARHSVERLSRAQLASAGLLAGMIVAPELREYGDLAQTGLGMLFLKFSRDDERQADELGFRYLNRGGYEAREMVEMFRTLDRVGEANGGGRLPDWLSTHPNPVDRIERIEHAIAAAPPITLGETVERAAFFREVDGVTFGPNPREGFFKGQTFHHPELAFSVTFPEGWSTENRKDAVIAASPQKDAAVVLSLAEAASAEAGVQDFFAESSVQATGTWRPSVRGFRTAARSFSAVREGEDLAGLVLFVENGKRVYRLLGYTAESRSERYRDVLATSLGSFERLRDRRYLDVKPKRIKVVRVPRRMVFSELLAAYPSTVEETTVAIINHMEAGEFLEAGDLYKRVVGGRIP